MKVLSFTTLFLLLFSTYAYPQTADDLFSLTGFRQQDALQQLENEQQMLQYLTPDVYRNHLYQLTRVPNIAGTEGGRSVINYMTTAMEGAGLDVRHYDYDAYMPKPGSVSISLVRPIRLPLNNQEYIYDEDPQSMHAELTHGWNAYSGSGNITAGIVYANYGRKQDFEQLVEMGIEIEGKIVVARYGGNFRGFKAKFAEEYGAAGLIIYTDPADNGYMRGLTYPEGKQSDESAIQRGSLLTLDYYGDPLTPFEPALPLDDPNTPQRLNENDVAFHTIPVAPIGYGAAKEILSRMDGSPVPGGWQGGLPFTYRLDSSDALQVHLDVEQPLEYTRITNVAGVIEGSEYPDEWIILGSHHDAWGFGATDPNSGTAMLLTLADALGELMNNGWQPKRSILIAHWDAEEFMLIGSSEWVEDLREELSANAILYLNADMSVTGPNFRSSASPSLKKPIIEATKVVPHPDYEDRTVYETWVRPEQSEPSIGNLGGGSDHVGFYMHLGVPSAGVAISSSVPVYHTNFDTFHMYESFLDSSFTYGPTLAGVYGVVATRFAMADILPYDLGRYATDITQHIETLSGRAEELGRPLDGVLNLESVLNLNRQVSTALVNEIPEWLNSERFDADRLREINQKLIRLERSFANPEGLPFSEWQKSVYVATNPWSGYASWMIPGVRYVLEDDQSGEMMIREAQKFQIAVSQLTISLGEIYDLIRE